MSKNSIEYLKHIKDECCYILAHSGKLNYEEFINNETLKRSFVRSLEIIGEATKHLPVEITQRHPSVNWKDIARMRDVLIHAYFEINTELFGMLSKTTSPNW